MHDIVYVFVSSYQATKVFQKGGGVSRWGEWVGKATAYKFDTGTLIGVHSTMHLVDPIKVHVSYTCMHSCTLHDHHYKLCLEQFCGTIVP